MPPVAAGNLSVAAASSSIAVNEAIGHGESAVGEYPSSEASAAGVRLAIATSAGSVARNITIRHRQGSRTGDPSAPAAVAENGDPVARAVTDHRDIRQRQVT